MDILDLLAELVKLFRASTPFLPQTSIFKTIPGGIGGTVVLYENNSTDNLVRVTIQNPNAGVIGIRQDSVDGLGFALQQYESVVYVLKPQDVLYGWSAGSTSALVWV
ncbi:hypothetical protein IH992_04060 [Candidatus Poribacteria bacterium]|nr:hypothetical protein [Candidatus Poribacteria bacterium]